MKIQFNYRTTGLTVIAEAEVQPSVLSSYHNVSSVKVLGCIGSSKKFEAFMKAFEHNQAILKDEAVVQFNAWKRLNNAIAV